VSTGSTGTAAPRASPAPRRGGAQAGERARPAPESDGVQRSQLEARLGQQAQRGGDQRARGLRAAGARVQPLPRAALHADGQLLGAGVEGQEVHRPYFRR
jgi:hypothetical protein